MSKRSKWLTTAVTATLMVTGGVVIAQSGTDTLAAHMAASRANGDDGIASSINPGRDIGSTNNSRPGNMPIPRVYTPVAVVSEAGTDVATVQTAESGNTVAIAAVEPAPAPAPVAAASPSYVAPADTTAMNSNADSGTTLPPRADRN